MTGIKIVYTEHSVWQYLELGWLRKAIAIFLLIRVDAVVAISIQLLEYYNQNPFISKNKIALIINGIDRERFKKFDNSKLKKKLGFSLQDKLIGTVANLRPEKNHKVLIKAFKSLAVKDEKLHLILVGLDCMNGKIQQYAFQSGVTNQIHFLGARNDIPEILNILDVFCLPSKHEGLPLTVLESMACGIPVIGADVIGINEVITNNMNGLLFPKDDEKALSKKILTILTKEKIRVSLIKVGLNYVKENYCLEDKIVQYDSLFQSLMQK